MLCIHGLMDTCPKSQRQHFSGGRLEDFCISDGVHVDPSTQRNPSHLSYTAWIACFAVLWPFNMRGNEIFSRRKLK